MILGALLYYAWFWEVSSHANQILYTIVLLIVFVWCLLIVFTIFSALLVWLVTRRHNRNLVLQCQNEVGGHIESQYAIFSPFFLPFVTIETDLEQQSFKRHTQMRLVWEKEWLEPIERGRFHKIRRNIKVKDIFGLTAISFFVTQNADLEILPASSHPQIRAFQTRTTGDGYSHPQGDPKGELIEMRRYQAGDPLRLVLWKVFARSRKLVVRSPEPAIVEQNDMFVYFVSGLDDEASASMARALLGAYQDEANNLCFAADGAKRIVKDASSGLSDIIDSVEHKSRGAEDLLAVAPLVTSEAMKNCFLLVPPKLGKWLEVIKNFVAQYQIRPTFIITVNHAIEQKKPSKSSWLKKMLVSPDKNADEQSSVYQICDQLKTIGMIRIVDISTGTTQEWQ